MTTHYSTLAWKTPKTGRPGRLQSMGLLRVGHDWVTSLSFFTFLNWRRKWQPLKCSFLENSRDGGAWWVAVYGVAQNRTRLKRFSSSSSSFWSKGVKKSSYRWRMNHLWSEGRTNCKAIVNPQVEEISCHRCKNNSRKKLLKLYSEYGHKNHFGFCF